LLKKLAPIQNEGTSAREIARIARQQLLSNNNLNIGEFERYDSAISKYALI
jgi:hypothetical protein